MNWRRWQSLLCNYLLFTPWPWSAFHDPVTLYSTVILWGKKSLFLVFKGIGYLENFLAKCVKLDLKRSFCTWGITGRQAGRHSSDSLCLFAELHRLWPAPAHCHTWTIARHQGYTRCLSIGGPQLSLSPHLKHLRCSVLKLHYCTSLMAFYTSSNPCKSPVSQGDDLRCPHHTPTAGSYTR